MFLAAHGFLEPASVVVTSLTPAGVIGDSAELYSSVRPSSSASVTGLASNGSGFLASYVTSCFPNCTGYDGHLRAIAVDAMGAIALGEDIASGPGSSTAMVASNGSYVAWGEDRVHWVDAAGHTLSDASSVHGVIAHAFDPDGASFGVVPESGGAGFLAFADTRAIRLDQDLAPLDDPPLATIKIPAAQIQPTVTFDSKNYVASWVDVGREAVVAARISPEGSVLDADPMTLVGAPARAFKPQLASNGTDVLATWSAENFESEFAGATLWSQKGGTIPVTVPNAIRVVSVALGSDGTDYLAAWGTLDAPFPATTQTMQAARILPSGALTNAIELGRGDTALSVVYDGEHYVAAWGDATTNGDRVALAARITRDLSLVDAAPKELTFHPSGDLDFGPRLAAGNGGLLVVWVESAGETTTVRCVRLNGDLEREDTSSIVLGEQRAKSDAFRVAWDGSAYWVVWMSWASQNDVVLLGRRILPNGTLLDVSPFQIALDIDPSFWNFGLNSESFGLSPGRPGELLVVYEGSARARIIRARRLSSAPGGGGDAGGAGGEAGASGDNAGGTASGGTATGGRSTTTTGGATTAGKGAAGSDDGGDGGAASGSGGSNTSGAAGRGGGAGANNTRTDDTVLEKPDGGCECSLAQSKGDHRSWAAFVAFAAWTLRRRWQRRRVHDVRKVPAC